MKFYWIIGALLLLGLCAFQCRRQQDGEKLEQELLQADRNFSALSVQRGAAYAFYYYIAEDGIALPHRGKPRTKATFEKLMKETENLPITSTLEWEPLIAKVASSGDLDYTHGRFVLSATDTTNSVITQRGYYITIWKRYNGEWKFIADAGKQNPELVE